MTPIQRTTAKWLIALGTSFVAASGCSDDKSDALYNEEFTVWCGENPCAWIVEEGDVAPSPTWHRSSTGIAFNSNPARISQRISLENPSCVGISILGVPEGDAQLFWGLDFGGDGPLSGDERVDIPLGDWKTVHRESDVPEGTTDVRLILEKRGTGKVVLAWARFFAGDFCSPDAGPY